MRPITITDGGSIDNLYQFVFVDKVARGPHIHAITIPQEAAQLLQGVSEELLRRLLAILSAATRVHTLSLHLPSNSSSSLLVHPLIIPAIARLSGIREITLVASFERANALLRCIRSPVEVFRLSSLHKDLSALRDMNFIGLSARLSVVQRRRAMLQEMDEELALDDVPTHLGSTLCELELPHAYVPRRAFSLGPPGPFLSVRSFVLRDVAELVRLDVLLHMLPNLNDTLVVEASPLLYNRLQDIETVHVETIREANRLTQARYAWKKLDRVIASPLMVFTLSLICPIRHLTLDFSADESASSDSFGTIARHARCAVLRDHMPTHLTIRGLRLPAGLTHLDDLLSVDEAPPSTTHIVIIAEYKSVDDGGKLLWPDDIFESLLARIEHLGLTHVRVVISGLISDADPFSASVHHGIRDLPLERLATQFQRAVPSLDYLLLTSRGVVLQNGKELQGAWDVSKAWRVPSAATTVTLFGTDLEELSVSDAEAVQVKEDIQIMGGTKGGTKVRVFA